jgi:hypothetical protein
VERVKDECRVSPPLPHPDFDLREAQPWEPSEEIEATPAFDPLPIESLMDLLASVDIAGPAKYLVQGVIAAADYGMLGAAFKVGKTWFVTDLAVSVASNTKLLAYRDSGTGFALCGRRWSAQDCPAIPGRL